MYGGEEGITAMLEELELLRKEPPNDPLTLEEMREMDGEPVWVNRPHCALWDILCGISKSGNACFFRAELSLSDYGKTWLAYRRKPDRGSE